MPVTFDYLEHRDIVKNILSYLPLSGYAAARLVCVEWNIRMRELEQPLLFKHIAIFRTEGRSVEVRSRDLHWPPHSKLLAGPPWYQPKLEERGRRRAYARARLQLSVVDIGMDLKRRAYPGPSLYAVPVRRWRVDKMDKAWDLGGANEHTRVFFATWENCFSSTAVQKAWTTDDFAGLVVVNVECGANPTLSKRHSFTSPSPESKNAHASFVVVFHAAGRAPPIAQASEERRHSGGAVCNALLPAGAQRPDGRITLLRRDCTFFHRAMKLTNKRVSFVGLELFIPNDEERRTFIAEVLWTYLGPCSVPGRMAKSFETLETRVTFVTHEEYRRDVGDDVYPVHVVA